MAAPGLQHPGFLLANLKVDSPGKTLTQRCRDLAKIIDDHHAKELHAIFSWLAENIFGSLDGILAGWNLRLLHSRCQDFAPVVDFLAPSGPIMKMVYKLQAEEYKYEVPVNYLPAPVRTCIQEGVLPDCPLFHYRTHFPVSGVLTPNLMLNPFEFFMFSFATCLITPKYFPAGQHGCGGGGATADSAYFVLVDMYLKYFLPTEGSVPPSPFFDNRGPVSAPSPRSANVSLGAYGVHSPSLLKPHIFHQPSVNADPAAQEIWRSETLLQMLVEVWLHHYSLEMYQKLQSPQVKLALLQYRLTMSSTPCHPHSPPGSGNLHNYQEPFSPSEEHVLAVRLLVKHLHAFSNSLKPDHPASSPTHSHAGPLEEFKRVALQRFVRQKLFLFLQHCFGHWPLDASFRAVLETWLSYVQPWRYADDKGGGARGGGSDPERWESFVQENLLVYTKLFQVFLNRAMRTDLVNAKNALMLFRVSKVFSQPDLADLIHKAEQLFLEPELVPHHRQPRGYPTPGQGAGPASARQRAATDAVFRVKSHVYALEGQDCRYRQMFGPELRSQVLKSVRVLAGARQTAKRVSDRSGQAAANRSFLSWLAAPAADSENGLCGVEAEDGGECLKKTHEFLDRALENLCTIFKLNQSQLTQLVANAASDGDEGESERLPDCVPGEDGPVLTDLGRMQMINGLRRLDVTYRGDPELQPIRSYENAPLVRLLYRLSCLLNAKFEGQMAELCSRRDLAGRLGRRYLGAPAGRPARLCLRPLASYGNILALGVCYVAGALLSLGPVACTFLILGAVLLHGVAVMLWEDGRKAR
ncbi:sphingomyelin phosphodiesterase 4 isoform X1 [Stigmatopora argus]